MVLKIVQVPMDEALKAALDELADATGKSRAEIVREACHVLLEHREMERLEREYLAAHAGVPDSTDIGETQVALLEQVLEPEDWSAEYDAWKQANLTPRHA